MKEYIEHTCGECIHSEICEQWPTRTGWDTLNPVQCRMFRNAADVVEVVRCKDCKHQGDPMACPMCQEGFHYDEDDGWDYFTVDLTTDDGFCDRGERRDSDEN